MNAEYFSPDLVCDAGEIHRAIATLHPGDDVIELRAIHRGGRKRIDAGCFDSAHRERLVDEAVKLNAEGAAVYCNLNELDPQLLSRYANRIEQWVQATATDNNVKRRRWLLIDIDPQRPKDTSATATQLDLAMKLAGAVLQYLTKCGWPKPVSADSGNGLHFLYRIDLPNDKASTDLVKGCLGALAARFDDEAVKIDCSVHNAARIVKLHGTVSRKGDNVVDAPWRLSKLRVVPDPIMPVSLEQLQTLAAEVEAPKPKTNGSSGVHFDSAMSWTETEVGAFLTKGGIEYDGPDSHEGAQRWKLKRCPFNADHGFNESAVFLQPNGRLGFKCLHNGCKDRHWQDLRELVDGPRESRSRSDSSGNSRSSSQEPQHSEPEPLRRPLPPPQAYPMDALGDVLGPAACCIRDVLCVPDAMAGQSILGAASLAVQPHADVEIDGRRELLSLWLMTVGVSGERKSACDHLALRRHREHERAALEGYQIDKRSYELDLKAFELASKAVSKKGDALSIRDELERFGSAPQCPMKPLLLVATPTIEAVHIQLRDGRPSIGLFHDDAGEFLGGHSMSQEHRVKTAASASKLWDVGEFDRIRAADGGSKYYGKRLALHLMMQPVIAEMVLSDDLLTGQGFLARCLLSWPASTIGTRSYVETDPTTAPAMRHYWDRVSGFLSIEPSLRADTRNELEPRLLSLTPEAKRRWIAIHNVIEGDMGATGAHANIRAWASKAPAQVLRIAGVLTLIENPVSGVIEVPYIDRAASLVDHYLTEAVRIVGTHSVPKAVRDAEALLGWCHESGIEHLHSSAALQFGPNCVRSKANFDDAMGELERSGWADKVPDGLVIEGKHRRRVWRVRLP